MAATNYSDIDETLISYGTPRQQEIARAVMQHGSSTQAAIALGVANTTVRDAVAKLRRRAARRGWAPGHDMDKPAPEGYHVKGTSTLYGPEGEVKAQWVKTQKEQEERLEEFRAAVEEIAEPLKGRADPAPVPADSAEDLLCVYPAGDPHFGMYAWHAETGEDFDLATAERDLVTAVDKLVSLAPAAKNALIINLGDFFHTDTQENRTRRSGVALDVDTRWRKVLGVGLRAMEQVTARALRKHEHVTVVNVQGNHDEQTSMMLGLALESYFHREPRVTIDTSPDPFHWYRFGRVLIGATHGDRVKARDLPAVMACDRAKDWGETSWRYWYTGHVHHESVKEFPGCVVETFRTLAAKDAWHHASGYRADRDMRLDIHHRERGRVARHIVGIEQIRSAA